MARSTNNSDSLAHVSLGQIRALLRKLEACGVKRSHLRRLCTDDELAGRVGRILKGEETKEENSSEVNQHHHQPGVSYDAVAILGFGQASDDALPAAAQGEVVIRYDGWSLQELRNSPTVVANDLLWDQDWYNKHDWSKEGVAPGIYRLRMPVPGSAKKTFTEQVSSLRDGEEPAPIGLVATALLSHLLKTGRDLLNNDWTRCREKGSAGNCVSVRIGGGRLGVRYDYSEGRRDDVRLCAVQKTLRAVSPVPKNAPSLNATTPEK